MKAVEKCHAASHPAATATPSGLRRVLINTVAGSVETAEYLRRVAPPGNQLLNITILTDPPTRVESELAGR